MIRTVTCSIRGNTYLNSTCGCVAHVLERVDVSVAASGPIGGRGEKACLCLARGRSSRLSDQRTPACLRLIVPSQSLALLGGWPYGYYPVSLLLSTERRNNAVFLVRANTEEWFVSFVRFVKLVLFIRFPLWAFSYQFGGAPPLFTRPNGNLNYTLGHPRTSAVSWCPMAHSNLFLTVRVLSIACLRGDLILLDINIYCCLFK
jgi:hypothetical protein